MKVNVYTSYYAKMAKRKKNFNDVYIQISRSCYCPMKDLDGIPIQNQIDYAFLDLGNYSTLADYEKNLPESAVETLVDFLQPENWQFSEDDPETDEVNVFLLCFENLKAKWTKKDEEKYFDVKAGDFKKCHRTILAGILNKKFNLDVKEYQD